MCNFLLVELCDLSTSVFCWLMRKSDSVSHLFTGQKQPVFTISGLLGGLVGVLPPHWSGWIMEWDQEPPSAAASPPHASVSGLWWRMDGGWRMEAMFSAHVFHVSDLHLVVPFLSPEPFSLSLFICIADICFCAHSAVRAGLTFIFLLMLLLY